MFESAVVSDNTHTCGSFLAETAGTASVIVVLLCPIQGFRLSHLGTAVNEHLLTLGHIFTSTTFEFLPYVD